MSANFSAVGINFNTFNNLTLPNFGINNLSSASEFIDYIPQNANSSTGDLYGVIVLMVLLIFLIWMLTDISQYGLFRYSTIRALGIALGICSTIGIILLSVGYATNFIHVSIMVGSFILTLIYTIIANPS